MKSPYRRHISRSFETVWNTSWKYTSLATYDVNVISYLSLPQCSSTLLIVFFYELLLVNCDGLTVMIKSTNRQKRLHSESVHQNQNYLALIQMNTHAQSLNAISVPIHRKIHKRFESASRQNAVVF